MSFSRKIFAPSHSEKQRLLGTGPQIAAPAVCSSGWLEETLNKNN
jgi:hypothetical protein